MAGDWALGRAWVARQSNSRVPPVMEGNNPIWCHIFLQLRVCFSSLPRKTKQNPEAGFTLCFLWWSRARRIITSSTIFTCFATAADGTLQTFVKRGETASEVRMWHRTLPHFIHLLLTYSVLFPHSSDIFSFKFLKPGEKRTETFILFCVHKLSSCGNKWTRSPTSWKLSCTHKLLSRAHETIN